MAGFRREPFSTLIVELDADAEMLLAACGRNTRYKVQRAAREGAIASNEADWQRFVAFYNAFAKHKGLATLDGRSAPNQAGAVRKVTQEGVELVMHSYLIDRDIGRARLLHSASLLHGLAENASRAAVGRANRFLHYDDMLYFRRLGLRMYDFGGYALDIAAGGELEGINRFKQGFGGRLLAETNYTSMPLWLLRRLRAALDERRRRPDAASVK